MGKSTPKNLVKLDQRPNFANSDWRLLYGQKRENNLNQRQITGGNEKKCDL
jgi:hypothetical protein